jgi:hypothetical protein
MIVKNVRREQQGLPPSIINQTKLKGAIAMHLLKNSRLCLKFDAASLAPSLFKQRRVGAADAAEADEI